MVSFKELKDRVKTFFGFSKEEIKGVLIGVLLVGFIFSFRNWGLEKFNPAFGFQNLILTTFAAAIAFLGHLGPPAPGTSASVRSTSSI